MRRYLRPPVARTKRLRRNFASRCVQSRADSSGPTPGSVSAVAASWQRRSPSYVRHSDDCRCRQSVPRPETLAQTSDELGATSELSASARSQLADRPNLGSLCCRSRSEEQLLTRQAPQRPTVIDGLTCQFDCAPTLSDPIVDQVAYRRRGGPVLEEGASQPYSYVDITFG